MTDRPKRTFFEYVNDRMDESVALEAAVALFLVTLSAAWIITLIALVANGYFITAASVIFAPAVVVIAWLFAGWRND